MTPHGLFLLFHFKHYLKKKKKTFYQIIVFRFPILQDNFCYIVSIEQHIRCIREAYGWNSLITNQSNPTQSLRQLRTRENPGSCSTLLLRWSILVLPVFSVDGDTASPGDTECSSCPGNCTFVYSVFHICKRATQLMKKKKSKAIEAIIINQIGRPLM